MRRAAEEVHKKVQPGNVPDAAWGAPDLAFLVAYRQMAVSKNQGPYFGSPYYKDHYMFGSILGPLFMKTPR